MVTHATVNEKLFSQVSIIKVSAHQSRDRQGAVVFNRSLTVAALPRL
jgi:hypothetical protein